jgi:hypothetical protein
MGAPPCDDSLGRGFLYLSTYYIEYDEYGIELLDAVDAAQRRGRRGKPLDRRVRPAIGGVLMSPESRSALAARLARVRRAAAS